MVETFSSFQRVLRTLRRFRQTTGAKFAAPKVALRNTVKKYLASLAAGKKGGMEGESGFVRGS